MQCHIVATAIYAIGWQFQLRGISHAKHLLAQESSALNNRDVKNILHHAVTLTVI